MSYWITLMDDTTGAPVMVARHEEGGTTVVGGTTQRCGGTWPAGNWSGSTGGSGGVRPDELDP